MIDFESAIDWVSIKLNFVGVAIAAVIGGNFLTILGIAATGTTIIYNIIRIYKEFKKNKP